MDTFSPILIGAAVAAVVAFGVRRILRARARDTHEASRLGADITFMVVGALLMALSVVVGRHLLEIKDPPRGELFRAGAGIATDVRPAENEGFVAGMAVHFHSCDEMVDVTLVVAGMAEYFEDNESLLAEATDFTLALPGTKDVSDVTVAYGNGFYDALVPQEVTSASDEETMPLESRAPVRRLAVTAVRGSVVNWASHLRPLVARFRADWLLDRGLGTCYLKLPPLVGDPTIVAAEDAQGRAAPTEDELVARFPRVPEITGNYSGTLSVAFRRRLAIPYGVSVVEVGGNDIIRSEPEPNAFLTGVPAVACSERVMKTGSLGETDADLVSTDEATAFAVRGAAFAREATALDCSGLVTVAEAGASSRRDLVLLLVGAAFSFGAALVLEVALDLRKRRMLRRAG